MNENLIKAVGGTVLIVTLAVVCGYLAWINYLGFHDSVQNFVWDWSDFTSMVTFLFLSGLSTGISLTVVQMARTFKRDAEREQERQKLKEEIKRELEMEKKKGFKNE